MVCGIAVSTILKPGAQQASGRARQHKPRLSLQSDRLKCVEPRCHAGRWPEAAVAVASRRFAQKLEVAGLSTMTDIAGERRAPDAGREHDGAVVKRGELRTMTDADDGCIFELAHQALQ
jgi:hypothetical protein